MPTHNHPSVATHMDKGVPDTRCLLLDADNVYLGHWASQGFQAVALAYITRVTGKAIISLAQAVFYESELAFIDMTVGI